MQTWQFIQQKNSGGIKVVLLYVLHSKGSSPGRRGFRMAVAGDGSFCGSIGGGIMEHKFVEMAKARLAEAVAVKSVYRQVHDKESGKHQSGMICSGEQTIFLYLVQPKDMLHIDAMTAALQKNKNGLLTLSNEGISYDDIVPPDDFLFSTHNDGNFSLMEKTGYKNILHVVGGGHCALALSRLMSSMDFYIHVYEDRKGLNTIAQNQYAHEKHAVDSYTALEGVIEGGRNVYVVIMTFGYRTDDLALKALWKKDVKYLGLLGSKNKIGKMFADYAAGSVDAALLKKIYSPVGLAIKSQTPEEIAISIAAEIILVKNRDQ